MGSDSRSYERFNTRDGSLLGSGRLAIAESESVVTVGRCLLYTDANARLHLFDSASGKDELEDDPPILALHPAGRTICRVLENNRVLVVSASLELILIDIDHGRVIFITPAATFVNSGDVFSISAFERHGPSLRHSADKADHGLRFSRHSDVVRHTCQTARCCVCIQSPAKFNGASTSIRAFSRTCMEIRQIYWFPGQLLRRLRSPTPDISLKTSLSYRFMMK